MPWWTIPLFSTIATVLVGLQTWILRGLIMLQIQVAEHRQQLARFVSDVESEKGTRKRIHTDFEARLRAVEFSFRATQQPNQQKHES